MVGVVRVSLARQPVLGADLQMGIERKPLVGVSDQAHDEPRRPRPHTAPILGSLSRSCKEFPGIDYLGSLQLLGTCRLLPVTRKLAPAASAHSRKRLSGSSGDAATVWAGAARILTERSRARKRAISAGANFRRGYKSTCSYSLRIGSDTHSWTFSFNPKRDDQGLNPLFVDVGRNQDIGIQNQADHLERRLSDEGFCPFRTAATSLSIWPALSLLAPAVKVINHYGDEVLKVFPA